VSSLPRAIISDITVQSDKREATRNINFHFVQAFFSRGEAAETEKAKPARRLAHSVSDMLNLDRLQNLSTPMSQ